MKISELSKRLGVPLSVAKRLAVRIAPQANPEIARRSGMARQLSSFEVFKIYLCYILINGYKFTERAAKIVVYDITWIMLEPGVPTIEEEGLPCVIIVRPTPDDSVFLYAIQLLHSEEYLGEGKYKRVHSLSHVLPVECVQYKGVGVRHLVEHHIQLSDILDTLRKHF